MRNVVSFMLTFVSGTTKMNIMWLWTPAMYKLQDDHISVVNVHNYVLNHVIVDRDLFFIPNYPSDMVTKCKFSQAN